MAICDKEGGIFRLVFDCLPVGIVVYDSSDVIVELNLEAQRLSGYSRDELADMRFTGPGDNLFEVMACAEDEHGKNRHEEKRGGGREAVLKTRDGKRLPVIFFDSVLKDATGNVCGKVKMFRDISTEKSISRKHKILISMFAHDLKAPVAIAGGFVNRLLMGKGGKLTERQLEYLQTVKSELEKLNSHIHAFLNILRMEAGEIRLSLEKCSIEQLIYEVVSEFREQAALKKIHIKINAPEENVLLMADRDQLRRVIINLIDNAIKYSPENSKIDISVKDYDRYIVCSVKDAGPGIVPEDLPHIFDPFFRSASDRIKGAIEGSGIGLAIVKSIVEAHQGSIWVDTDSSGATFSFSIPKKQRGEEQASGSEESANTCN